MIQLCVLGDYMISLILGITAFVLFFIYDLNSISLKNLFIHRLFITGSVLMIISCALDLYSAFISFSFSGISDIIFVVFGFLSAAALIYCLFFALPFGDTYINPEEKPKVYSGGVYALCRHPGLLCFFLMYAFFGIAALPGKMLEHGVVLSVLNLLYTAFQDAITLPKSFSGYPEYRKTTPFLLPTAASIKNAIKTFSISASKEDGQ